MMRYRKILMYAALFLAAACTEPEPSKPDGPDKPDPQPAEGRITVAAGFETIFNSGITAPAEAQTYEVKFNATQNWSTNIAYTGPKDWLSILPTKGSAGDVDMTVTIQANTAEDARTCSLTIKCDKASKTISITQAGAKTDPGPGPDPVAVESVTLNAHNASLYVGESGRLVATVLPDNATDKTVTWASDEPGVASVDQNGVVTAVSEGTAVITATAGGKSDSCIITVIDNSGPAEEYYIRISPKEVTIYKGETITLNVTTSHAFLKFAKRGYEGRHDASVIYVNPTSAGDGFYKDIEVTGLSVGSTEIAVEAYDSEAFALTGLKDTCYVTVIERECSMISLDMMELTIAPGSTFKLTATTNPAEAAQHIKWVSANEAVATVNDGTITAVANGTTIIAASAGSLTALCTVTVAEPVAVTSITLDKTSVSLAKGKTLQLTATVNPKNATDKTLTWASSNDAVVTVSPNGLLTGVAEGKATITVSAGSVQATCSVEVTNSDIEGIDDGGQTNW